MSSHLLSHFTSISGKEVSQLTRSLTKWLRKYLLNVNWAYVRPWAGCQPTLKQLYPRGRVRPTNKLDPNNRICATTDGKTDTSQDLQGQLWQLLVGGCIWAENWRRKRVTRAFRQRKQDMYQSWKHEKVRCYPWVKYQGNEQLQGF